MNTLNVKYAKNITAMSIMKIRKIVFVIVLNAIGKQKLINRKKLKFVKNVANFFVINARRQGNQINLINYNWWYHNINVWNKMMKRLKIIAKYIAIANL